MLPESESTPENPLWPAENFEPECLPSTGLKFMTLITKPWTLNYLFVNLSEVLIAGNETMPYFKVVYVQYYANTARGNTIVSIN